MKRLMLVWVMMLCLVPLNVIAEDTPADSPLIGLWHFETDDDWYDSYVEFTEDGLYVFQMIEDGAVYNHRIDQFTDGGDFVTLRSRGDCPYALDSDRLTIYFNGREMPPTVYSRANERPPELMQIRHSGDFCYVLHDENYAVIRYYMGEQNPTADVLIPDQLDGYPVTVIGSEAFKGAVLASVTVPSSVLVQDGAWRGAAIHEINITENTTADSEFASGDTITAMASPVNPEHLDKASCYARILGYDVEKNTLTVELIVPEVFPEDDVLELEVGDSIYTGGEEVLIRTIDWYEDDGYLVINAGAYEHAPGSIYLHQDYRGNYMPDRYAHPTYNTLAVLDCPIADTLLFLDYTSEETGDPLELPIVRTADEFLEVFFEDDPDPDKYEIGLDIDNVYVVFDGDGQLAMIARFFVSWQ